MTSEEAGTGSGRRWALVPLALIGLHVLAAMRFPWEGVTLVRTWLRLSPDLALLLCLGFVLVRLLGESRAVSHAVALGALMVPLYRLAATAVPNFYGRELNLYDDLREAPALVHLLTHTYPVWLQWVWKVAATLLAVAAYAGLHRIVRYVLRWGGGRRVCPTFVGTCLVLAGVDRATAGGGEGPVWSPLLARSLAADGAELYSEWSLRMKRTGLAEAERKSHEAPGDLRKLRGADVYVLFIESYGRQVLAKPEAAALLAEHYPRWTERLAGAGYHVLSGYGLPPVAGGLSSLAHLQLMTGVFVPTRRTFDMVLGSRVRALPRCFAEAGYRTFNVQPAMPEEWPASERFYGFTDDLFQEHFAYQGRTYHWGMPDQFVLAHLLEHDVRPSPEPVFAMYASSISHAPFSDIPPYYPDWEDALRPDAFAGAPERGYSIQWSSYATHPDVEVAYVDTIRYSLEVAVGFALELRRPSLVLVLGDHQPPGVSDLKEYDLSYHVPFHAIMNEEHLWVPFRNLGFEPGFLPSSSFEALPTTKFHAFILHAFSEGDA